MFLDDERIWMDCMRCPEAIFHMQTVKSLKGLLDYAILWEISLLRKKNCLESCKQVQ